MRSSSALPKTNLPKFLLVPFQKPINTYASPGDLLMKSLSSDRFTSPSVHEIADFKLQLKISNEQQEYQQTCAVQRPSTKI